MLSFCPLLTLSKADVMGAVVTQGVGVAAGDKVTHQALLCPQPALSPWLDLILHRTSHSEEIKRFPEAKPRPPPGWSPSGTKGAP